MLPLLLLLAADLRQPADQPLKQPQLAAAHGQVALAWGAGSSLYFAASADAGKTFAPSVKVADSATLMVGRHRGPRVTILPDAIVITAMSDTDLTVWRSTDRGRSFTRTGVVNDLHGSAREGLHAIVADAKGNLFASWLDLRGLVPGTSGTKLYGSRSTDGGVTWSKNVGIYAVPGGTICQCCDPSLAIGGKGEIQAMFRNALDGSRDLYLAHSADGIHFSAAQKLGEGTWKLDACPMDGGALAVDRNKIYSTWRRGNEIFLDIPGQPEVRIGEGKDVSMAMSAKGPVIVWSTAHGIEMHAGNGAAVQIATEGAFPNLVSLPDGGVLAAWETNGAIHVERLP